MITKETKRRSAKNFLYLPQTFARKILRPQFAKRDIKHSVKWHIYVLNCSVDGPNAKMGLAYTLAKKSSKREWGPFTRRNVKRVGGLASLLADLLARHAVEWMWQARSLDRTSSEWDKLAHWTECLVNEIEARSPDRMSGE